MYNSMFNTLYETLKDLEVVVLTKELAYVRESTIAWEKSEEAYEDDSVSDSTYNLMCDAATAADEMADIYEDIYKQLHEVKATLMRIQSELK